MWWIRAWEFPRLHLLVLALIALIGLWPLWRREDLWGRAKLPALILLAIAACYQAWYIYPYTPIAETMSQAATETDPARRVTVLVSNVLQSNREYDRLLSLIGEKDPDVVLALETDQGWIDHLQQLGDRYPHRVEVPLPNTYGMALYSKLPLVDQTVRYLVKEDVPSIRATLQLRSGTRVTLYALHPLPPSPQESASSLPRDAELVLVAEEIKKLPKSEPVLLLGDLNDVAWSTTTLLFLRLSGTLDPRRGRGLYNTFNVYTWPLRVPLDHVFHSKHFGLGAIQVEEAIGSDHFPIYVELSFDSELRGDALELEEEDEQMAEEKLEETAESDMGLPPGTDTEVEVDNKPDK